MKAPGKKPATTLDTLRATEAEALTAVSLHHADRCEWGGPCTCGAGKRLDAYAAAIEARVLAEHEHLCEGCHLVRDECTCSMFRAGAAHAPTRSP